MKVCVISFALCALIFAQTAHAWLYYWCQSDNINCDVTSSTSQTKTCGENELAKGCYMDGGYCRLGSAAKGSIDLMHKCCESHSKGLRGCVCQDDYPEKVNYCRTPPY